MPRPTVLTYNTTNPNEIRLPLPKNSALAAVKTTAVDSVLRRVLPARHLCDWHDTNAERGLVGLGSRQAGFGRRGLPDGTALCTCELRLPFGNGTLGRSDRHKLFPWLERRLEYIKRRNPY